MKKKEGKEEEEEEKEEKGEEEVFETCDCSKFLTSYICTFTLTKKP